MHSRICEGAFIWAPDETAGAFPSLAGASRLLWLALTSIKKYGDYDAKPVDVQ